MICLLLFVVILSFILAGCATRELQNLQIEFQKGVGSKLPILTPKENPLSFLKEDGLEEFYLEEIKKDALGKILSIKIDGQSQSQSQYFVYVDRSPNK